ncbi:hypothetical protein TIFTF001_053177 [Ficus carica]|uniref:Uncharacterized protein n=1 Tax=Ficus carica TaxID=3494 RepID=A0AA88EGW6_FICCA|nr:hypothetical protein TIFTF001_053177 [Ficus carica]
MVVTSRRIWVVIPLCLVSFLSIKEVQKTFFYSHSAFLRYLRYCWGYLMSSRWDLIILGSLVHSSKLLSKSIRLSLLLKQLPL